MKRTIVILSFIVFSFSQCMIAVANGEKAETDKHQKASDVSALYHSAQMAERKGDVSRAISSYDAVGNSYEEGMTRNEKQLSATSYYRVAELCAASRQYSLAMNRYLSALHISDRCAFNTLTAQVYIGIGNLYSQHCDYEMGIRFYKKALKLAKGNAKIRSRILNNLVGASVFMGRIADGKAYYNQLKRNKVASAEYQFNLLMCQGLIDNNQGHTAEAIGLYRKALDYAKAKKLDMTCVEAANSCLAQIYVDTSHVDSALYYLHSNERSALSSGNNDLLEETFSRLSTVYAKAGNSRLAMEYKIKRVELSDSLYNKEEFNDMKNAQFLYEANKSAAEISALTQQKLNHERLIVMQRRWIATLVGGCIVILVLLIFLYKQKRQLYDAYKSMYLRSQEYLQGSSSSLVAAENVGSSDRSTPTMLSDEQRRRLLSDISTVMSNTDEYCQSDFSIEHLAALIGSNSRYVSEAINEGYGKNFRTFLNEYRIKEAMRRLADGENYGGYTIKAISESVGYKSQANFITQFSKLTGMKPSVYQKLSKG